MKPIYEYNREYDNKTKLIKCNNDACDAHFHSNIEIVYVVEGEINITINGQNMTLTKGCVSIAGSYDIHSYKTLKSSKTIVLIIPTEIVGSFTKMMRVKLFAGSFMEQCGDSKEIYYAIRKLAKMDSAMDSAIGSKAGSKSSSTMDSSY